MQTYTRYCKLVLGLVLFGGLAGAKSGQLRLPGSSISVIPADEVISCPLRGAVCFRPGGDDTVSSLPEFASAGAPQDLPLPDVPTFKRMAPVSEPDGLAKDTPWVIGVAASALHHVEPGDSIYLFYDVDASAGGHEEVVAAVHAQVPSGAKLAARMTLQPEDGFKSGHTYRLRVSQADGGESVSLAQGEFSLR